MRGEKLKFDIICLLHNTSLNFIVLWYNSNAKIIALDLVQNLKLQYECIMYLILYSLTWYWIVISFLVDQSCDMFVGLYKYQ